jgi:hypothetical protein
VTPNSVTGSSSGLPTSPFNISWYGLIMPSTLSPRPPIDISNRIPGRVERELKAQGYPVVMAVPTPVTKAW